MNILVCFSVNSDIENLSLESFFYADENNVNRIHNEHLIKKISAFDETALEFALKNKTNDDVLYALNISDTKNDIFLRQILAIGYDHAAQILTKNKNYLYDSVYKSKLIYSYIQKHNIDIVIFGQKDGQNCQGLCPDIIASYLNVPSFNNCAAFTYQEHKLTITSKDTFKEESFISPIPAVLKVGNIENIKTLRIPTLMQKMNAKKKPIETIELISNDQTLDIAFFSEVNTKNNIKYIDDNLDKNIDDFCQKFLHEVIDESSNNI